ncbi:MAG: response regulator [bacterium]|nr:response regulator [bacterium]
MDSPHLANLLPRDKVDLVLDNLDRRDVEAEQTAGEKFYRYRVPPLLIELHEPGGTIKHMRIATRSMGKRSLRFIHCGYVYPGTRCAVRLTTVERAWITVKGNVVSCEHVEGRLHEGRIEFGEPLDPARFVPIKVSARVLLAESIPSMREMARFVLQKIGADTTWVDEGGAAIHRLVTEEFDLALIDPDLPGLDGGAAVRRLRKEGVIIPVIAFSTRIGDELRQTYMDVGFTDVLHKPVERHQLVDVVRSYVDQDVGIYSALAADPELEELVSQFVGALPDMLGLCRVHHKEDDLAGIVHCARHIKGACGTYGFAGLADVACEMEELTRSRCQCIDPGECTQTGEEKCCAEHPLVMEEMGGHINHLIALGRRVRKGPPP